MGAPPRIGDLVEIVTAIYALPGVRGHLVGIASGDAEPYRVHGLGGLVHHASTIRHPTDAPVRQQSIAAARMRRRRTAAP